jgi:hypothetical protein
MILNAKSNQFRFLFPKGFIYPEIEEKYSRFLKKIPGPFESMNDYVNHTIQGISFPSVQADTNEQINGREVYSDIDSNENFLTKNPRSVKGSFDMSRVLDKNFTVTLKASDGFLNYWILFENLQKFLQVYNPDQCVPDFQIQYLDYMGYQFSTINYRNVLFTGISEMELTYSSVAMDFRTFTVNFKYSNFDIQVLED